MPSINIELTSHQYDSLCKGEPITINKPKQWEPNVEKLCVFCEHFTISTGCSELFYESCGDLMCDKEGFSFNRRNCSYDQSDILSIIHTAKTCEHYVPVKE